MVAPKTAPADTHASEHWAPGPLAGLISHSHFSSCSEHGILHFVAQEVFIAGAAGSVQESWGPPPQVAHPHSGPSSQQQPHWLHLSVCYLSNPPRTLGCWTDDVGEVDDTLVPV